MSLDTDSLCWYEARHWREANLSPSRLLPLWRAELEPVRNKAFRMEALLGFIIPIMEELCEATCPTCSDPCCQRARVHFDLPDLLFLHLTGQAVPLAQPGSGGVPCRYLGARGCILPRLSRPWTCRRYICPEQKRLLRHYPASGQRRFESALTRIRGLRRDIEDLFVHRVSP